MTRNELMQFCQNTFRECHRIMQAKNTDYTGSNPDALSNFKKIKELGISPEDGLLTRMTDKFMRMGNLLHTDPAVAGESLDDTIKDVINYAVLLRALLADRDQGDNQYAENTKPYRPLDGPVAVTIGPSWRARNGDSSADLNLQDHRAAGLQPSTDATQRDPRVFRRETINEPGAPPKYFRERAAADQ